MLTLLSSSFEGYGCKMTAHEKKSTSILEANLWFDDMDVTSNDPRLGLRVETPSKDPMQEGSYLSPWASVFITLWPETGLLSHIQFICRRFPIGSLHLPPHEFFQANQFRFDVVPWAGKQRNNYTTMPIIERVDNITSYFRDEDLMVFLGNPKCVAKAGVSSSGDKILFDTLNVVVGFAFSGFKHQIT